MNRKIKRSKAREFVYNYWFTNEEPSKAVTEILNWIKEGKLTSSGKQAYKRLIINLE